MEKLNEEMNQMGDNSNGDYCAPERKETAQAEPVVQTEQVTQEMPKMKFNPETGEPIVDATAMPNYQQTPNHIPTQGMQNNMYVNGQMAQQPTGGIGFGVAALILGIVSIVLCCTVCVPYITGALAIIFGIVHLANKRPEPVLGIVGIITGAISIILVTVLIIISAVTGQSQYDVYEQELYEIYYEDDFF